MNGSTYEPYPKIVLECGSWTHAPPHDLPQARGNRNSSVMLTHSLDTDSFQPVAPLLARTGASREHRRQNSEFATTTTRSKFKHGTTTRYDDCVVFTLGVRRCSWQCVRQFFEGITSYHGRRQGRQGSRVQSVSGSTCLCVARRNCDTRNLE